MKLKTLYFFLFLILSQIILVSSTDIDVFPKNLQLDVMPGESVERNITIKTSGIYAVRLNLEGTDQNITINSTEPFIVDGERNLTISFIFGKDIEAKEYDLQLNAELDIIENVIIVEKEISIGGGGGTRVVYRNRTINQTEIEEIFGVNETAIKKLSDTITSLEEDIALKEEENNSIRRGLSLMILLLSISIIFIIFKWFSSNKKKIIQQQ